MKKLIVILAAFGLALSAEAQETCSPTSDINQDGIVGTGDLLALLSDYGIADADFDGINDLFDDCIEDECGVCDGPGATLILIDAITVLYDSVYLPLQDEWFVYEIGADTTFVVQCEIFGCLDATACNFSDEANVDNGNCDYISCYGCNIPSACNFDALATMFDESCDFESCAGCLDSLACNYDPDNTIAIDLLCDFESCAGCTDESATNYDPEATIDNGNCLYGSAACDLQTSLNYHGHDYELVAIGDRCWFAENLRTTKYATGTSLASASYTYPDNNAAFLDDFGRLYKPCAITNSQSICPSFWHTPTSADYNSLIANYPNANAVKASPDDDWQWNGTNESGLTLVPAGNASVGSNSGYSYCDIAPTSWGYLGFNGVGWYYYQNGYFIVTNSEEHDASSYMMTWKYYSVRCVKD